MKTLINSIGIIALILVLIAATVDSTPDCEAPADVDINVITSWSVLIDTQVMPGALAYQFKIKINGFCPFTVTQYVADGYDNPNAFTHGVNSVVEQIEVKARILCTNNEFTGYTPTETLIIN